jgi:hypothetical protein
MFKVTACEDKNKDWKVISFENVDGDKWAKVSVNRIGKKGDAFPDFDNVKVGAEIRGVPWQSEKGNWYLFPPKKERVPQSNDQILSELTKINIRLGKIELALQARNRTAAYPEMDETNGADGF